MKSLRPLGKSIMVLFASVSLSQAQGKPEAVLPFCAITGDQGNCVRLLACVGNDGHYFHGRSFGKGEGTLAGKISTGATCTGTWISRNGSGFGQADVACDDGLRVRVTYTYQDARTGTAIGRGIANDGTAVTGWSGLHVLDYLNRETGLPKGTLLCGDQSVPIS